MGHQNEEDLTSGGGPDYKGAYPGVVTIARIWDYLAVYVDKALGLRLPPDGYPTDGPLTLRTVDANKGYLIDPFAIESMFELPAFPLEKTETAYRVAPSLNKPATFMAIPPAKGYEPPGKVGRRCGPGW